MNIGTKLMTVSREEAELREFPGYSGSGKTPHTLIDLSNIDKEEHPDHTISVRLPNGDHITFCIIPFWGTDNAQSGAVDFKYHGKGNTFTMPLDTNGDRRIASEDNLYTLEYHKENDNE